MNPLLSVKNIKKSFGKIKAVNGISFNVDKGKCFGLLGPNGAGKTTLMEIIAQIIKPDEGEILFKNEVMNRNCLKQMGIQFQQTSLPHHLTVKETLEIFSSLYPNSAKIDDLIQLCQLDDFQKQKHAQISGGQKQRLLLAIALCNNPELILLDEPTTGLDPQARRHLWNIVKNIKKQGKTVILTTHYMDEAYELCDEIGIMDNGKMIALGTPKNLLKESFSEVILQINIDAIPDATKLKNFNYTTTDFYYQILSSDLNQTLSELTQNKIDLSSMSIRQSSLEDLFIKLTGNQIRN